jgi:hypothetical protein
MSAGLSAGVVGSLASSSIAGDSFRAVSAKALPVKRYVPPGLTYESSSARED